MWIIITDTGLGHIYYGPFDDTVDAEIWAEDNLPPTKLTANKWWLAMLTNPTE